MFRALSGFKAKYGDLTLVAVSEFDEWHVIVHSPEVVLQGTRQFKDNKAKEHAVLLAQSYLRDVKQAGLPESDPDWQPTSQEDWLVWKV
jgi:hypothetical protein